MLAAIDERMPALKDAANANLRPAMLKLVRDLSDKERAEKDEELFGKVLVLYVAVCRTGLSLTARS